MNESNIQQSNLPPRPLQLVLLILAGESVFFLPFVLARVFRPTFLSVFEINNLELGTLYSIYGIVAMAAYFLGGPLADRFSPRLLIAIALVFTGLGGLVLAFAKSLSVLCWLYAFWGMTTILLFWAALIKATRVLGGHKFQARAFGFLEGGRGFIAAFASSIAVGIFAFYLPEDPALAGFGEQQAFQYVIYFFSGWVVLIGVLIWFGLRKINFDKAESSHRVSLSQVAQLVQSPKIWYHAIIIVCAYVGYKITDDFSLLAKDILGYSDVEAAQVGTIALWMRVITAILAGILADRIHQTSKVVGWAFLLMSISGLVIGSGVLPTHPGYYYLMAILITCLGVYSVRGLYFALMEEANIPTRITGTAIGLISVIGFTPEVFMGPLMGALLDGYPGPLGHQLVFLVLAGFASVGWVATILFQKVIKLS